MARLTAAMMMLALIAGCGARTEMYEISVRNDTAEPITIGLAKQGPPYEDLWATPEEVAIITPGGGAREWGITVPPGKTGYAGPIGGRFGRESAAYLRVYVGDPTLEQLLAISRSSPNRLDLLLSPGRNDFVIHDRPGRLAAAPADPPDAADLPDPAEPGDSPDQS